MQKKKENGNKVVPGRVKSEIIKLVFAVYLLSTPD